MSDDDFRNVVVRRNAKEGDFRRVLRTKMLSTPNCGYEWVVEFRDSQFLKDIYVTNQTLVRPETSGYRYYGGIVEFIYKPNMKAKYRLMEKKDLLD